MAKASTTKVRLISTEGTYHYYVKKSNKMQEKLEMRKYDPDLRRHVIFKEKKMPPSKK